jgi:lysophospholipase L1-like esterase
MEMKRLTQGILSLFVACALIETLSRAYYTIAQDTARTKPELWYTFSREFGWTGKPGYKGPVLHRPASEREFDSTGFVAGEMQKFGDTTAAKILFIGDSNMFGFEVPFSASFPVQTDSLLENAIAVNMSLPAYSSYQGMILVSKFLRRFHPDIMVISFNYNDRRHVLRTEEQDSPAAFERRYSAFQTSEGARPLEFLYTFRALRFALRSAGLLNNETENDNRLSIDSLVPRVSPAAYKQNLIAIISDARKHNVVPMFLLLGDNPVQTEYVRQGVAFFNEGKYREAVNILTLADAHRSTSSLLARKFLSRAYRKLGNEEMAQRYAAVRPQRFYNGGDEIEVDTVYHSIMRDVARGNSVELVDGAAVLNAEPSVFFDSCHFDERGHRMIAELLATRIGQFLSEGKRGGSLSRLALD